MLRNAPTLERKIIANPLLNYPIYLYYVRYADAFWLTCGVYTTQTGSGQAGINDLRNEGKRAPTNYPQFTICIATYQTYFRKRLTYKRRNENDSKLLKILGLSDDVFITATCVRVLFITHVLQKSMLTFLEKDTKKFVHLKKRRRNRR